MTPGQEFWLSIKVPVHLDDVGSVPRPDRGCISLLAEGKEVSEQSVHSVFHWGNSKDANANKTKTKTRL